MTEALILVIVMLISGYVLIAVLCWITWRDDDNLHARIREAASLRGEMAPLPPREQKSQPETAPESEDGGETKKDQQP